MNPPFPTHADEEYSLPPVEALLAGTLALMTGCAQHSGPVCQRELMVGKVVSNLTELAQHPALSQPRRSHGWHDAAAGAPHPAVRGAVSPASAPRWRRAPRARRA
jgi:hypothetical protein